VLSQLDTKFRLWTKKSGISFINFSQEEIKSINVELISKKEKEGFYTLKAGSFKPNKPVIKDFTIVPNGNEEKKFHLVTITIGGEISHYVSFPNPQKLGNENSIFICNDGVALGPFEIKMNDFLLAVLEYYLSASKIQIQRKNYSIARHTSNNEERINGFKKMIKNQLENGVNDEQYAEVINKLSTELKDFIISSQKRLFRRMKKH
jgi:hypothetical protein